LPLRTTIVANISMCPFLCPSLPIRTSLSPAPAVAKTPRPAAGTGRGQHQNRQQFQWPDSPSSNSFSIALFPAENTNSSNPFPKKSTYLATLFKGLLPRYNVRFANHAADADFIPAPSHSSESSYHSSQYLSYYGRYLTDKTLTGKFDQS
jgi:hypothetical protein